MQKTNNKCRFNVTQVRKFFKPYKIKMQKNFESSSNYSYDLIDTFTIDNKEESFVIGKYEVHNTLIENHKEGNKTFRTYEKTDKLTMYLAELNYAYDFENKKYNTTISQGKAIEITNELDHLKFSDIDNILQETRRVMTIKGTLVVNYSHWLYKVEVNYG